MTTTAKKHVEEAIDFIEEPITIVKEKKPRKKKETPASKDVKTVVRKTKKK